MRVMLLSAGYGKRMLPLTLTLPKPLLPFRGKPIIEHQLIRLAETGFQEIIINLGYLGSKIKEYIGDGGRWGLKVSYTQEEIPLEWGGGIVNALSVLGDEPFLALSGDLVTAYDYSQLKNVLKNSDKSAHVVLVPNPEFHAKGDFGLEQGCLSFESKHYYNYAGISVLRPEIFKSFEPGVIKFLDIMQAPIKAGLVSGELYSGEWHNIGTPAQLI
ncbi:MAG: NDP-sugar synthase [Gammaproteobacteria bacterium]